MDINIIYSDKSIAVAEKPSGVPSQPDKTGDMDMLTAVGERFGYAGLIHRLDRPVSGLMVFALNKGAEKFVLEQMSGGGFGKNYAAVCCGVPKSEEGELRDWLVKNQRLNISSVSNRGDKNAKEAVLRYRLMETMEDGKFGELSLLDIKLLTGRHHQIRVQTANAGMPLWGDTKYNPEFKRGYYNIFPALYSRRLEFVHPDTKKVVVFEKFPEYAPFTLFTKSLHNFLKNF